MHIFTDNPIRFPEEDQFGFVPYAQILRDAIWHAEPLPLCVGIFGSWGSGKSSFMQMLQKLLERPQIRTLWFNPWKYDKKEDLWSALIQTILHSIADAKDIGEEVKETTKKLARATAWLMLKKAVSTASAGLISEEHLEKMTEWFSDKDQTHYREINHFEEDFAEAVKKYTHGGKLVIFIDDLDRCLPENAITVLESLKLFIGHAQCIFVLGMDHHVVEEGIKVRFGEKKITLSGREYLDKIIQIPFFLPPVRPEKLEAVFNVENQAFSKEIWNIIQLGMDGNPRKVKRFVNSFSLLERFVNTSAQTQPLYLRSGQPLTLKPFEQSIYLAKLLVFQISFPAFHQHLQHVGDAWAYLEEQVIEGQQPVKPELKEFWENLAFQRFMRQTAHSSYLNYPKAPGADIVVSLLQATSLVTPTPENNSPSAR